LPRQDAWLDRFSPEKSPMDGMSLRFWPPRLALALSTALLLVGAALGDEAPEAPRLRVARLIRDLGANDFSKREQANDQLTQLGQATREQLEAALDDPDVEVRLRARQLLDRLKLDDLWKPAIVRCRSQGQTASKVLLALAAQSGNHIHIGEPYGHFGDAGLDVNYDGMSYWEAVDDICGRSSNRIRPHYDTHTRGIVISAGTPPRYPRAYSGPVRAQITGARRVFIEEVNYEEHKAELTHSFQINLQFSWEDRFTVVGYANQPELVEAVTDNQIVVSAAQSSSGGWSATTRGLRQVTASLKLNPVSVSAKAFDVFKVRWGLIAVGEAVALEINDLQPDKLYAQDDLNARIENLTSPAAGKHVLTMCLARDLTTGQSHEVVAQEYEVELLDGEGRAMRLQNQQHQIGDRGLQLTLNYIRDSTQGEPKSVRVRYPRLRSQRDLELAFRNVPLPVGKPE
jgi:hypothetical protein